MRTILVAYLIDKVIYLLLEKVDVLSIACTGHILLTLIGARDSIGQTVLVLTSGRTQHWVKWYKS